MRRWYSKRGARRGLLLAAAAAALWGSWAVGFIHGSRLWAPAVPNIGGPATSTTGAARRVEL